MRETLPQTQRPLASPNPEPFQPETGNYIALKYEYLESWPGRLCTVQGNDGEDEEEEPDERRMTETAGLVHRYGQGERSAQSDAVWSAWGKAGKPQTLTQGPGRTSWPFSRAISTHLAILLLFVFASLLLWWQWAKSGDGARRDELRELHTHLTQAPNDSATSKDPKERVRFGDLKRDVDKQIAEGKGRLSRSSGSTEEQLKRSDFDVLKKQVDSQLGTKEVKGNPPAKAEQSNVIAGNLDDNTEGPTAQAPSAESLEASILPSRFKGTSGYLDSRTATLLKGRAVFPAEIPSGSDVIAMPYASRVIVSEKSGIIYCPVPKAANSNWKMLIRRFEGFNDYKILQLGHERNTSGLRYLDQYRADEVDKLMRNTSLLKFLFVRNPFDRLLSCYLNKFEGKDRQDKEYYFYMTHLFGWEWTNSHDVKKEPKPTFPEFVNQVRKQPPDAMDEHWAPQSYICGIGHFPYDFVGRFENITEESNEILRALKKEVHFPSQNEIGFLPSGASSLRQQWFSEDLAQTARQIYPDDFSRAGYNTSLLD